MRIRNAQNMVESCHFFPVENAENRCFCSFSFDFFLIFRVQTDPGKPGKPGKCRLLEKIQGKSGKLREFFFKLWITQGNSGNFIFQIPYNRIACISRFGVPDFQKFFSSGPTMVAPQVPLKSLRCLYNVK